jgi:hypothetical protein
MMGNSSTHHASVSATFLRSRPLTLRSQRRQRGVRLRETAHFSGSKKMSAAEMSDCDLDEV